jgi:hypothetical protein
MADIHKVRKGQRIRVTDNLGVQYEGDFSTVIPARPTSSEAKWRRELFVIREGSTVMYFPTKDAKVTLVRKR